MNVPPSTALRRVAVFALCFAFFLLLAIGCVLQPPRDSADWLTVAGVVLAAVGFLFLARRLRSHRWW